MRLELPLAQLLAILAASRLAGAAMRPLGQPRVIGEIAAGLALGPSVLGALAPALQGSLFPADAMAPLATMSQLGVLLFMFTVGLRLDLGLVRSKAGAAVVVSQASILAPFALGALIAPLLHPHLAGPGPAGRGTGLLPFTLFLGAAMSVTASPVLARLLADRGLAGTRLGTLAIACAAVDDATAWLMLAAVVGVAPAGDACWHLATTLGAMVLAVGVLLTAGRAALGWAARQWQPDDAESLPAAIAPAIGFALAAALMTEWAGIHALFGAFLAGVLMNTRGLMEFVVLNVGLEHGGISPTFFTMMVLLVLMALVTTAMTSPLLGWLRRGQPPRAVAPATAR